MEAQIPHTQLKRSCMLTLNILCATTTTEHSQINIKKERERTLKRKEGRSDLKALRAELICRQKEGISGAGRH